MRLSKIPNLNSNISLLGAAGVTAIIAFACLIWLGQGMGTTLGDTDDAMRLVLVRDLLAGRGWYDQWIGRLQPPAGVFMHWSRLVDGGLAAMTAGFRMFLSPAAAETATRSVWPLCWALPAIVCALAMARRLGGAAAVFVCAVMLSINLQVYEQFHPGRIDHHNVQIVMLLVAACCAMARERRQEWAVLAGAATGLGLAVGIEALPFHAIIGAYYGLRLALDPVEAKAGRNYALALLISASGFYGLQTPPDRWSLAVCDALGSNLLAAIGLGSMGLIAVSLVAGRLSTPGRLVSLVFVGGAAISAYLAIEPLCIRGPFASVDPRLHAFWFDHVEELQSWPSLLRSDRATAIVTITAGLSVLVATLTRLASDRTRMEPEIMLASVLCLVAVALASQAFRMQDYVFWLGFPMLAWLVGAGATRYLRGVLVASLAAAIMVSPLFLGSLMVKATSLVARSQPAMRSAKADPCFETSSYRQLAALPSGLVLGEIDLGSFVLANTSHSVVTAPYHRMSWGIYAAHEALGAPAAQAESAVRALKADYILDCPTFEMRVGPQSLEADLRHGRIPAWLLPVSAKGQALQVYRVLPRRAG